jgi:putative membrane protein
MKFLLIRWATLAVAVWITTMLVSGIHVDGGAGTYFVVAIVLATVNAIIGTVLRLFTLPLILLTLGLFSLVISAWMLLITDWLMDTLTVDGFSSAFWGALVIAIVNVLVDLGLMSLDRFEQSRRTV